MAGRIVFDIAKKYLPNATKAVRNKFKTLVDDYEVTMPRNSAIDLALSDIRKLKKPTNKSVGGFINTNDYYKDIL